MSKIKEDIAYLKDENKLMRINKLLANKKVLLTACLFFSFIIFTLANYIIVSVPKLLPHLQGKEQQFSFFASAFDYSFFTEYIAIYIILIIAILIVNLRVVYLIRTSYKEMNIGQKGTARWTSLEEIQAQYKEIKETGEKGSVSESGGIPISRIGDKLYIDDSAVNNLIIGITRSGKGEMFVFPMIDIYSRAEKQASLIITDPKLELYASSRDTLIKRGYDVHLINLVEPLKSAGFNPLSLIIEAYRDNDYSTAEMLCNSFVSSIFSGETADETAQFFSNASMGLTSALILALIEDRAKENRLDEVNMYLVVQMFTELSRIRINETTTALDYYFSLRPLGDKAKSKYAVVEMAGEKTKGNVFSHVLSKLTIFTYEEIAKMTNNSKIDLVSVGFGKKPIAVFIGIPDYDVSNHYLASVFISQLQFVLSKKASLYKDGKCEREVVFILDEFGNLPRIPNMDNTITVCLGRNIKYNLVIQSYSQIENKYGI